MEPRFNLTDNELGPKIGKRFANVSLAIMQSPVSKITQELVELRCSQINGCGYCADAHAKELAAAGEPAVRINLVATWRESIVFSEAERAALAFAEEGTRIADAHIGVSDDTWAKLRNHYDDNQTVTLVYLVAMINAANRLGVILHQKGGSYQPGMFGSLANSLDD
jgi:AhpD family alkylhydroperoxidase